MSDPERWAKNMSSLISKIKRMLSRDYPKDSVKFDDGGFAVFLDEKQKFRVEWLSVKKIFAYKDDLGTYDDICIGFCINDAGEYFSISEDYIGYRELLEELNERFPEIKTDWFSDVAFPAFAQNRTTLWGTPQPQTQK